MYYESIEMENAAYICTNCGEPIKELYKRYSPTVLKLCNCVKCSQIADKYVEYDPVIIIIDLILLNREAYRHVLFNTQYNIHWKLWLILQLMEAYSDWSLSYSYRYKGEFENKKFLLDNFVTADFEYYKAIFKIVLKNAGFVFVVCLSTLAYNKVNGAKESYNWKKDLMLVWKCITLSSFGIFLALPSLVWDKYSSQGYDFAFVSLYTTLSQLVAYTVTCRCAKLWSIIVILLAYFCKLYIFDLIEIQY